MFHHYLPENLATPYLISEWIIRIEDISDFVEEQRPHASPREYPKLTIPREEVYPVSDPAVAEKLGLATC